MFVDSSKMTARLIEALAGSPLADLVSEAAAFTVHPIFLPLMGHHGFNQYLMAGFHRAEIAQKL